MSENAKTTQPKKSLLKKTLKWSGITFLLLIVLMICIPIIFKDDIKQLVLKEVNKSLKADVSIQDIDLTFISTFPAITIELSDVKVVGRTAFKGVELAAIKSFSAHVGFWDIVSGDQIEIDEIHLSDARFDVRVDPKGMANYDIVIPTEELPKDKQEEPSSFKLSLNEYSLTNVAIRYDDQASDLFADIVHLNHTGSGDLTADVIDFNTETTIDSLTYKMDGLTYLSHVKTKAIANLLMEFSETSSKFTFRENEFELNNFKTSLAGSYEMFAKHDEMDLKMNTNNIAFKDLLSLVPSFYQSGYESMIAKGNVQMKAVVKGKMDDKNLPGWDVGLQVKNAQIKYAGVPSSINNIVVDAGSAFAGGSDLDKMTLDVNKFHADFVGNVIDANLKMRNPMTDPLIDSKVKAKVNLASIGKVMPLATGESYQGKLNADVVLNGRMSAIEKENYEAFQAKGIVELFGMNYKSADLNEQVAIEKMTLRFSPKNLSLEKMDAKMGKSDFSLNGTIDNYLGYFFRNELLKGQFDFNSNYLDIDQLMGVTTTASTPAATTETASSEPAPVAADTEPILIPENVDFALNSNLKKVHYNGIDVTNIKGNIGLKEEVAALNNLTMNALGGTVGLTGSYNSKDHNKPAIDFGYNLGNIDIQQLAKNFLTIKKLAPIAQYAQGKISSKLTLKSDLTKALEPVYTSLTGSGDLFTNMITLSGFEPMKKIGESLNMNKLSNQTIKDVKAYFSMANGKIKLKPFTVKMEGVETEISGTSSIDQSIDYVLNMNVPKEKIPAELIKAAEQGLSKINGVIPKLNVASFPAFIKVTTLVGGTFTKPVIKTNFKEALLKATGNLKENIVNSVKEKVKDTVRAVIDNKIKEVKEDLNAKKQAILDDAQKQADRVKLEGQKAGDAIRKEAENQCANLMNEAGSNPIKKKAAEISCKQIKKTADNKAQKVSDEANEKADAIMTKAREKANAIQ
ncbi:MAG: hypothetical protein KA734_02135 [Fluviicola sp.]|nr:hypothetical protein [Fluviicola sp.]MBP6271635.1 hypothetical protein [Fluviicola sp.]